MRQATLRHGGVLLRPLRVADAGEWQRLRQVNQSWLTEWEATAPLPTTDPAPTFQQSARRLRREARRGTALPYVVEVDGEFVGQVNVGDIVYGSLRGCHLGYWISQHAANRGIMTMAVAMVVDHLLDTKRLHRVEIAIRPENRPSTRVVEHLGFRLEGTRQAFLHINGQWRDHNIYVMLADERGAPLVERAAPVRATRTTTG